VQTSAVDVEAIKSSSPAPEPAMTTTANEPAVGPSSMEKPFVPVTESPHRQAQRMRQEERVKLFEQ
jgi:hypothetical protein